mgnify:CR=1 FL=1
MTFTQINAKTGIPTDCSTETIVDFLFTHLEQYGDQKDAIQKCIEYVMNPEKGGQIGMNGYIPENILVYIAVDNSVRGKGFGKKLMQKAIDSVEGDIALHVEPDNPAKKLYENLGFTNKYLEMRLTKS